MNSKPTPRPLEHGLGDDGESDDRAQLQARHGDHRHQRVLQRVAKVYHPAAQPPRAGKADVILAQDLQHLGTDQAHDQRHLVEAQGDRRQDQRLEPAFGQKSGPSSNCPVWWFLPYRRKAASRAQLKKDRSAGCRSGRSAAIRPPATAVMIVWAVGPFRRIAVKTPSAMPARIAQNNARHGGQLQRRGCAFQQDIGHRATLAVAYAEIAL